MKKVFLFFGFIVIQAIILSSCDKQIVPVAGDWQGKGISFTVCETGDTITELNVVIPIGEEYLAQRYYSLNIKNDSFSSYRSAVPFVDIPEANLKGVFMSKNLAKGSFNGIEWTAKPVKE